MSTNGVDVSVEDSDSDDNDDTLVDNTSAKNKKTPYLNFFPMSCYQNVQFKQPKEISTGCQITSGGTVSADTSRTIEVDVINQPPPTTNQFSSSTTTNATAITTNVTSNTLPGTTVSSNALESVSEANSKTAFTVVEITTTTSSGEVVPSTANSNSRQSTVTTSSVSTSLSSDNTDGPVSTSNDSISTGKISGEISKSNSKVDSAVIEVGGINPVYQSWTIKKRNDSEPVAMVTPSKEVPNAGVSAYDLMEPILKPNSSVFFSAPSSVIDSQNSERVQPSTSSAVLYENIVPIGNGKFTITPPSSCDSKESLNFPIESQEQQTLLNRSNSTGSLVPRPTVQHHLTFYSPANNRKDLKHSVSLSATPQVVTHQNYSKSMTDGTSGNSKIHVRGSTAISRGTVKKKITLFESNTLPTGSKSLAEMGIFEDEDSNNGFVV